MTENVEKRKRELLAVDEASKSVFWLAPAIKGTNVDSSGFCAEEWQFLRLQFPPSSDHQQSVISATADSGASSALPVESSRAEIGHPSSEGTSHWMRPLEITCRSDRYSPTKRTWQHIHPAVHYSHNPASRLECWLIACLASLSAGAAGSGTK